jgi:hypothetical protein
MHKHRLNEKEKVPEESTLFVIIYACDDEDRTGTSS